MPHSLSALEARRAELLRSIAHLNDMHSGSIVGCRVALWKTDLPLVHSPTTPVMAPPCLTYKWRGKTVTEALPTPAAVRKAQQAIAEFRNYQQLGRELVDVSEQVCRLRPLEETFTPQKKKRPKASTRKSRAK